MERLFLLDSDRHIPATDTIANALLQNNDNRWFTVRPFKTKADVSLETFPSLVVELIKKGDPEEHDSTDLVFFSEILRGTDSVNNRFAAILGLLQRLEKVTFPFLPDRLDKIPPTS